MPQVCDEIKAVIDVLGVFQWYFTDRDDWTIDSVAAWSLGTLFGPMSSSPNCPKWNIVLTRCVSVVQYITPSIISDPVSGGREEAEAPRWRWFLFVAAELLKSTNESST